MTIYVFFPVSVFYYFNLPEFFDKYVASKRVSHWEENRSLQLFTLFFLFTEAGIP